ncbi:MAG: Zn-dependent dipeptidase [Caulobacter sp.]|nr:Zn-dependent dipeptidase [Caulobacter sp.]
MDRRSLLAGAAAAFAAAPLSGALAAQKISPEARRLYRDALVIDGNLVAPLDPTAPLDATLRGQVRASGLSAFKMTLGGPGRQNRAETTEECGLVDKAIGLNGDLFTRIRKPGDIAAAKAAGRIGLIASFEAGEMLEGQVESIDHFRALDVLVMGLSYNLTTPFGSGVMSKTSTGLTELGRQAVDRMNRLGVTLDISHSDETTGLAAIEASRRPVLVTHAGSGAIRPHPRNKSDRLMRALAERGGVIGIFDLSYISVAPE